MYLSTYIYSIISFSCSPRYMIVVLLRRRSQIVYIWYNIFFDISALFATSCTKLYMSFIYQCAQSTSPTCEQNQKNEVKDKIVVRYDLLSYVQITNFSNFLVTVTERSELLVCIINTLSVMH